jgi:hypothetical protein
MLWIDIGRRSEHRFSCVHGRTFDDLMSMNWERNLAYSACEVDGVEAQYVDSIVMNKI